MMRHACAAGVLTLLAIASADAQVRFERTGYRFTSIGQQIRAAARVTGDARGPLRWRVADTTIARVNAQGVMEARKPGYTRLWAVASGDSASAIILVDQWAATFDFVPAVVRLHAVADRAALRVQARDANGFLLADADRRMTACRSLDERVASLAGTQVTARANGVTYIRCTDRGVSDSVRVEVRQRVASAMIVDKSGYATRVVGDTFRIRLSARDVSGGDIRDLQATWASLNPMVVSVDPLSGMARSVGVGAARIVAQVGDATDTVSVQVLPTAGMAPIMFAEVDTSGAAADEPRAPALNLQSLFLSVGDTARVTPRDAAGVAIATAEFRLAVTDTAIVRALSGQRVVARSPGSAHVVVTFGDLRDSMLVNVREKSDVAVVPAGEEASGPSFARPAFNLDSARERNRRQLDSAAAEIRKQSVVAMYSGRVASMMVLVSHATQSTRDTNFLEKRSGLLYGLRGEFAPHRRVRVMGAFRTGDLAPTAASGEKLTVTEAEVDIGIRPAPWFELGAGYVRRATVTQLAQQRWDFPRVSALTRFDFVGGAVTSVAGLSLLPGAKYTGYLDAQQSQINPDPFSFSGQAGLELHSGRFALALLYYAERFSFPRVNNNAIARTDQFSALRVRAGYQLGR